MKQVLVLGGSGGIGRACIEAFQQNPNYRLTSVHRRPSSAPSPFETIHGDLCSTEFRQDLIRRMSPNVVVCSFGSYPSRESSVIDAINEFALSVIEIYEAFENKGGLEHFVVVSSLSAQICASSVAFMDSANYKYICSKRILSDFFRQTQLHMASKSRIVLVEPGFVRTDFADIDARYVRQNENDIMTRAQITPVEPSVVAAAIFRAVTEPGYPSSQITFHNSSTMPTT